MISLAWRYLWSNPLTAALNHDRGGAVVETGSCIEIKKSERVQQIYLGTGA